MAIKTEEGPGELTVEAGAVCEGNTTNNNPVGGDFMSPGARSSASPRSLSSALAGRSTDKARASYTNSASLNVLGALLREVRPPRTAPLALEHGPRRVARRALLPEQPLEGLGQAARARGGGGGGLDDVLCR